MSSFSLKVLAIIFMLIDHVGFMFFPNLSILRTIGRLAFPTFAFQISIGFKNTKNKEKYILRMIIFTLISQYPFWLMTISKIPDSQFTLNVGATLTLGLVCLYCIEKFQNKFLKVLLPLLILAISFLIPMDYSWYGVLIIILFYIFSKSKILTFSSYFITLLSYMIYKNSFFNLPAILSLIPIFLYNGKKGKSAKYLFYIFYPLHLLILVWIYKVQNAITI